MMKAFDYFKTLDIDYTAKVILFAILFNSYGFRKKLSRDAFIKWSMRMELPDDFKLPENVLELMVEVNKQVKHAGTPSFIKNRFYSYKNRLVKQFIKEGRVSDIWSEGYCYSMVIDGEYHIHQLKSDFNDRLDVVGERPYKHDGQILPLNMEQFDQFQIAAVYYLAKCRFREYGHQNCPAGTY